jgi:hypothetical protein
MRLQSGRPNLLITDQLWRTAIVARQITDEALKASECVQLDYGWRSTGCIWLVMVPPVDHYADHTESENALNRFAQEEGTLQYWASVLSPK